MINPVVKGLIILLVIGFFYLINLYGWGFIIGIFVGVILTNIIFYSNIPAIDNAMLLFTRGRGSNIKRMFNEDLKNEKRNKVRYKS